MRITTVLALTLFCNLSFAGVILEVNLSDPSAAIFSPTGSFADSTWGPESSFYGITLTDFFNGNTTTIDFQNVNSGSIDVINVADASARFQLVEVFIGTFPGGWTINDLNFFDNSASSELYFFTNVVALAGGATFDLSLTLGLPTVGTVGDVVIGLRESLLVVGQWEIVGDSAPVPTPATLALFGIGLAGLGWSRRKKA